MALIIFFAACPRVPCSANGPTGRTKILAEPARRRAEPSPIRKNPAPPPPGATWGISTLQPGAAGVWGPGAQRMPCPSADHAVPVHAADYRARRRLLLSTDRGLGAAATSPPCYDTSARTGARRRPSAGCQPRSGRTYHEVAVRQHSPHLRERSRPGTLQTASRALGRRAKTE